MCMRGRRYRWVLVLTACVLIGMLIVSALSRPDLPETVPVTQAAKEDVYNTVSVKGTVRAKRESQEFVYAPARVEVCYVSVSYTHLYHTLMGTKNQVSAWNVIAREESVYVNDLSSMK